MFAQSEISELFPTLANIERTVYTSYWEDCCGKSQSAHIAPRTEIDTINGKPYLRWGGFFLREENNQVLIYSFAYEDDLVLYDWSLEVGDSLSLLALDQYSFSNIEYPVVVDYEFYIDDSELDEDGIPIFVPSKKPLEKIVVKNVSTITLLDGKEYKKWSFYSGISGGFEYIEDIGCLKGLTFIANCYFNLIQPEAIPICYQGEYLVCASRNGQLLYQMSASEMERLGSECKCLNEGVPTDLETITAPSPAIQKVIYEGQLYIIRDGKVYNVMGVEERNVNFDF